MSKTPKKYSNKNQWKIESLTIRFDEIAGLTLKEANNFFLSRSSHLENVTLDFDHVPYEGYSSVILYGYRKLTNQEKKIIKETNLKKRIKNNEKIQKEAKERKLYERLKKKFEAPLQETTNGNIF